MKHRILRFDEIPFYAFDGETPFPADDGMPPLAALPCKVRIDFPGGAERLAGTLRLRRPRKNSHPVAFAVFDEDRGGELYRSPAFSDTDEIPLELPLGGAKSLLLVWETVGNPFLRHILDMSDFAISYRGAKPSFPLPPRSFEVAGAHCRWIFKIRRDTLESVLLPSSPRTPVHGSFAPLCHTFPPLVEAGAVVSLQPTDLYVIQADGAHDVELVFREMRRGENGETILSQRDAEYPVSVETRILPFPELDLFKVQSTIRNTGDAPLTVVNRNAACINLGELPNPYLTTFFGTGTAYASLNGGWSGEMLDFEEAPLRRGTFTVSNRRISHNSQAAWPGCLISFNGKAREERGKVFGAALGWDGNWQYEVTRHRAPNRVTFGAGAAPEPRELAPGEGCETPFLLVGLSTRGKGELSRNFHRYMRRGGIGNPPEFRPVVLNSWEGMYFDIDEAKLSRLAADAARLGCEMLVVDDGWFGGEEFSRDNDLRGLGDWQTVPKKLPQGLAPLIRAVKSQGLKFGLWFEPEMVNTASRLYHEHPEWVIRRPRRELRYGRSGTQLMLDLSRPEVEEFVYHAVADVLRDNPGIDYVKWDHNMGGVNQGAEHLGSRAGGFSDLCNAACRRVMRRLDRDFPDVIFQLCASGGGRADVGSMENFDEFWASDNSQAVPRISIQWGFSHFYPPEAMASHVSRHGLETSYKFRVDVAMSARLGVELDPPTIAAEDRETIRRGIAVYKELRPLLHTGELYRGRSPHDSLCSEVTIVAPDRSQAVLFAFDRSGKGSRENIKSAGLDADAVYRAEEKNPGSKPALRACRITGAEAMKTGLAITFARGVAASAVVLLTRVK